MKTKPSEHQSFQAYRGVMGDRSTAERGVALIIALTMLALITVMFLGYTQSMKNVNTMGKNYNEAAKAKALAEGVIQAAIAQIGSHTPPRSATKTWASGPGVIWYNNGGTVTTNYLFQNTNTGLDSGTNGRMSNTNQGGFPFGMNGNNDIFVNDAITTNALLDVYFANYGVNPTTNISATTNPLSYRVAYWVDDEATKINLNYASMLDTNATTNNTRNIGVQALHNNTNLTAVTTTDMDSLCDAIYGSGGCVAGVPPAWTTGTPTNAFMTLAEVNRGSNGTNLYLVNKQNITVYGRDDDYDAFGKIRLNPAALTNGDIIGSGALSSNLYDRETNYTWSRLGFTANTNFVAKYTSTNLKQINANILAWNQNPGVDPPPSDSTDPNALTYLGLQKVPLLNEVGIEAQGKSDVAAGVGAGNWTVQVRVKTELLNPYGVAAGGGYSVVVESQNPLTTIALTGPTGCTGCGAQAAQEILLTPTVTAVGAGSYWTLTPTTYLTYSGTFTGGALTQINLNILINKVRLFSKTVTLASANGADADFMVDYYNSNSFGGVAYSTNMTAVAPITLGYSTTWPALWTLKSYGRNDPRVARTAANYSVQTVNQFLSAVGTTNNINSGCTKPTAASTVTIAGVATCPSDVEPDPTKIYSGIVSTNTPMASIGEIGYISTGIPWRTLRLQPRGVDVQPPDWALLDLFRITSNENDPVNTNVYGRININQKVWSANGDTNGGQPAGSGISNSNIAGTGYRRGAARALYGTNITPAGWFSASANRVNSMTNTITTNVSDNIGFPGFDTIGEVCEIAETTDGGTNDAAQERVIRGIANNITVRSNFFSVWAVVQTVKDVNKNGIFELGLDQVLSEQKVMAIVERYETGGQVKFRIKHIDWL